MKKTTKTNMPAKPAKPAKFTLRPTYPGYYNVFVGYRCVCDLDVTRTEGRALIALFNSPTFAKWREHEAHE